MNRVELLKELEKYPVFNIKILGELIEKNRDYNKLVINRLKRNKLVFEIERNKYTVYKDPMIISSNVIWPSYISFWSALRYYNLTEQLPQDISIITTRTRKKRKIKFENININFIKVKAKYFFGYKKEKYGNFEIFIAEKEKAIIDSALFKKISFSEISEIVKNNLDEIDMNLFIEYLIKIKNKTLIKRFGFLLEKLGIEKYNNLKKFINFKYSPLDYAFAKRGKKNKKWKIIENVKL